MSLRDEKIVEAMKRYYEKCNYMGIPTIRWNEGLLLYAITYTYLTTNDVMKGYIVDAGAGAGFSTLWFVYAVRDAGTDHVVVAIDYYKRNLDMFREMLEGLDIDVRTETITGDACKVLEDYPEEIDILFIDVEKHRYIECVEAAVDRIKENGIVLAHNMLFPYTPAIERYIKYLSERLGWKTIVIPTEMGIGLSIKRLGD